MITDSRIQLHMKSPATKASTIALSTARLISCPRSAGYSVLLAAFASLWSALSTTSEVSSSSWRTTSTTGVGRPTRTMFSGTRSSHCASTSTRSSPSGSSAAAASSHPRRSVFVHAATTKFYMRRPCRTSYSSCVSSTLPPKKREHPSNGKKFRNMHSSRLRTWTLTWILIL